MTTPQNPLAVALAAQQQGLQLRGELEATKNAISGVLNELIALERKLGITRVQFDDASLGAGLTRIQLMTNEEVARLQATPAPAPAPPLVSAKPVRAKRAAKRS